ncbi:hypothetical protein VM99_22635 [Pseudomonas chlororaphis]|uniref:Uncharacterized protein n=1 Tax=Pseudomonas chlororaphis TaxID=587753 RepID=A0A0G3GMH9_9PSED|nr:hypothetical protein VM99_22635 [Pseudomonas chlororaphis]
MAILVGDPYKTENENPCQKKSDNITQNIATNRPFTVGTGLVAKTTVHSGLCRLILGFSEPLPPILRRVRMACPTPIHCGSGLAREDGCTSDILVD